MTPVLALWLTVAFVGALFVHEARTPERRSIALWLPVLWIGISGSRFVSQWLDLSEAIGNSAEMSEGSLVDALYFLTLLLAGLAVLYQRRLRLSALVRNNPWLIAFFVYGLMSVLWSDFTFVALKRWIKTLGHPVMALIILTDADPEQALRSTLKRCAFLLLPFSVLLIKYFPQYGRNFDPFTGQAHNTGVALHKNDLGYVCMIFGLFFLWALLTRRHLPDRRRQRQEFWLCLGFLVITAWLFKQVNSATALLTFAIGAMSIVLASVVPKRRVAAYVLVGLVVLGLLELTVGLSDHVLALLGRNPTLTDRTELWSDVLALQSNPLLGVGFESFWLGERLEALWRKWWWHPIQAHNGYLDIYLNLGLIGLFLLLGLFVSSFRRINRSLGAGSRLASLQLAFLFAVLAYNFTEAGFKGVHLVWTIFTVMVMAYPRRVAVRQTRPSTPRQTRHRLQAGPRRAPRPI